MTIARIENGRVVEQRNIELSAVPEHKRGQWRPIEGDPPSYDSWTEVLSGPTLQIEEARVLRVWEKIERPLIERTTLVREEAQRRIIALMGARDLTHCFVKQLNANMREGELTDKRVRGEQLTAEEETEAQMLRDMAVSIRAIRAASNAIESDPPSDYADNRHWPQG